MAKKYEFFLILFITLICFTLSQSEEEEEEEVSIEEQINVKSPGFSRVSGFYPENFKLKLISEKDTKIFYTLDSSDPRTS